MDVAFEWDGLTPDELADRFREFHDAMQAELESAAEDIALRIEATAKRLAPVDTGQLRADINHVVEQLAEHQVRIVVGTNVEHGIYQEMGTAMMEAQPYLRPAIEAESDWIVSRVEEAVDTAATSAGFST